jgi:RHS repeat-associated protein
MKISFKIYCLLSILPFLTLSQVFGQGNDNPTGPTGEFSGEVTTGCSYDPYTGNATRTVTDLTVAGAVGKYGLSYARTWNSRNGYWADSFSWSIADVYKPVNQAMHWAVIFPDGRVEVFTAPNLTPPAGVHERFQSTGSLCYLLLPDGGKIEFGVALTIIPPDDPLPEYMSYHFTTNAIIDPYGQRTNYSYNTDGTLNKVTEPAGRWIQYFYRTDGQVDHILASDGRVVTYNYTTQTFSPGTTPYTVLTSVNYYGDASLTGTYTYAAPNMGSANGLPVLSSCNEPMYAGPMKKISYTYATGTNPNGYAAVYGQILSENDGTTGHAVSTLTLSTYTTSTETRADGKTRTFTYSYGGGLLTGVTDFKGVTQTEAYDANSFVNAITDRNGHTTNVTNNTIAGGITQIQYPSTPGDTPSGTPRGTVNYTYGWASCPDVNNRDANNPYYLYSITDEGGNTTIYTRDTSKRITQVNYPDGGSESFTYNLFDQIVSHVTKTGGAETFTYDARGLKQTYRDPSHASGNPTAWYQYDSLDRVSGVTDALGSASGDVNHTTSCAYSTRGQLMVTTLPTDPIDGHRHTIVDTYNANGDGTLTSVTDQLGHITSFTYDDYRRPLTKTTPQRSSGDGTNRITYFYYDANGTGNDYTHTDANVTHLTLPGGEKTTTTYDENLRKTSVIIADGTSDAAKTSYGYDNNGNLTSVVSPKEQSGQPYAGQSTIAAYDERNRVMSVTDPLGNVTSCGYDAAGHKASSTRPNGQTITYNSYDSMNRLLQQTVKQTPDPDAVTKYTYYASGLLHTMQDPKLVADNHGYNYSYSYDTTGREIGLTYPDSTNEAWHYDTAGRADTFTNRAGKTRTTVYDALSRVASVSWNDVPASVPTVNFGYDVASRTSSITNSNATITRTYFDDNLLNSETETPVGGSANTTAYTYNADGGRATLQFPNGFYSCSFTYTGRNQLQAIINSSGVTVAAYVYDLDGNMQTRTLVNSTSSTYTYDALDRVTNISHVLNGTTRTLGYAYDSVSNRKWTKRDGGNGDVFAYDLNDQVTTTLLNVANPDTTSPGSQTINYDANGNRTTFAAYGPTDTYTTNNLNQYTARNSSSAAYDNNGNITTGVDGSTYLYDAQNRLTSATKGATTETFKYDGLNRQVSRTFNGVTTYSAWDGWNLLEEIQSGSLTAAYMYGTGGLVKRFIAGAYYYQDGNGSTSHVADSTGNLQEWYRYDLQGTPLFYNSSNSQISASSYGIRHLFTGEQWYSELGLYDLRNRFYSPDIGRFLQADPIGFKGDPTNLYRYCGNNAVNRVDPLGMDQLTISAGYFVGVTWTHGTNGGQVNNGLYIGLAMGFNASYNPSDSGASYDGLRNPEFGFYGTAGIDAPYKVFTANATYNNNATGTNLTLTGDFAGKSFMGVSYDQYGDSSKAPDSLDLDIGAGVFFGFGGTSYGPAPGPSAAAVEATLAAMNANFAVPANPPPPNLAPFSQISLSLQNFRNPAPDPLDPLDTEFGPSQIFPPIPPLELYGPAFFSQPVQFKVEVGTWRDVEYTQ